MIKLWICLALIAISGCGGLSYDNDGWYDDYWYDDIMDKSFDDDVKDPAKSTVIENDDMTKTSPVYADEGIIAESKDSDEKDIKSEGNFDGINDYQFEDNRSDLGEENFNTEAKTTLSSLDNNDDKKETLNDSSEKINDDPTLLSTTLPDKEDKEIDYSAKGPTQIAYDDLAYSSSDSEKKIIEETKSILTEDTGNDFEDFKSDEDRKETDLNEIIEETSKLLDDTPDSLVEDETVEEDVNNGAEDNDNESKSLEDTSNKTEENTDEDTVDNAFNDLMSDIDRLHETWSKLKDYDDENVQSSEIGEDGSYDYEEIDDENLEQIFDDGKESKTETEDKEKESVEENVSEKLSPVTTNKISDPILYLNDALMASEPENRNLVTIKSTEKVSSTAIPEESKETTTLGSVLRTETTKTDELETTERLEDLSSAEVHDLMKEFKSEHLEEILEASTYSEEAEYVALTVDKPVVITSPNYPEHYPTNKTVDWIISGDGMGIELNITDFAVNGHVGDYLLIKPGRVDDKGSDGLLFSYVLRTERRYRFLDVDKMFIRFEAKQAMQFLRGFRLSLRMVVPRPGAPVPEPEPEPQPAPSPVSTFTLNLGGVSLDGFLKIEEQFRLIIADMATLYINTNNINPGINTTIETTQITSRALCFHNWPKFELCTEVRFGVPLVYDDVEDGEVEARLNEEDLRSMWETYSQRDPFAVRLRVMGITEYQVPNDRGTLIVWLVIAGGVVISMAMLAFALWRYSCFADYTRMPSFSDTDSVKEKRNLDLYPTPHQTLPPLYSETDYKWADAKYDDTTKVDIGGYSNRSYMHNDIYDIDSDEDAMTPRDRYTTDV
ncbi:myb-like protein V isoform X2 [Vanessa cardui]|uniref:myb-like protein V isoform X2 n=1 Tax=Vanessa cardui TaxID=171605 RepID=UPI001F12CA40|nr:myb-like protein V isoform X2 [Vanessa cardui]